MKTETIIITLCVISLIFIGCMIAFFIGKKIIDDSEGIITDKYILSTLNGNPVHYFVLDNQKEIVVSTETYYRYNIGDYYKMQNLIN